jgi:hypothetical protein
MKYHNLNYFIILALVILIPLNLPAQTGHAGKAKQAGSKEKDSKQKKDKDEEKEKITRWEFGLNFGTYFANKYTAGYYNGSDQNVNKISYVMSNYYWYQEIKRLLDASDTVIITEYPENMNYHVAITGGLFLRYNLTRHWGVFLQADYTQLKTDGEFTVEVDPASYLTEPDIRLFGVHGKEQRVNIDFGVHCKFPVYKNRMNLFVQAGMNVNYIQVMKSFVDFYGKEYSLINVYGNQYYVPNTNLQEYQNLQNGFGYGLYAGAGTGFNFTKQIGLELGGCLNYIRVNLEGYRQFKPSWAIYLRFLLSNLVNTEEEQ